MTLIEDFKLVLLRAWSIRLAALTAVFAVSEAVLPLFTSVVPPRTMAILAAISACGTIVARIMNQPAAEASKP